MRNWPLDRLAGIPENTHIVRIQSPFRPILREDPAG